VDFVGAFLNNELDVEFYIEVFEGLYELSFSSFEVLDFLKRYGWDPSEDQVILLGKGLYGLK